MEVEFIAIIGICVVISSFLGIKILDYNFKLGLTILILLLSIGFFILFIIAAPMNEEKRQQEFDDFKQLNCIEQKEWLLNENRTSSDKYFQYFTVNCTKIKGTE